MIKDRNFVSDNFRINIISALQNSIVTYICFPRNETVDFRNELEHIFINFRALAKQILTAMLEDGNYKFSINIQATFVKELKPDEKITASFNKGTGWALHTITNERDINNNIAYELDAITKWVELSASRAAHWLIQTVDNLELTCHKMS